ncbi:hypothetical protein Tco_0652591 [Tanacetum coccineum]|uniref:Uncharacterized protein n=1 Tax=Tanacetum coccineum TaxID=301880 RepID=A0ABQ4WY00_9ASTR
MSIARHATHRDPPEWCYRSERSLNIGGSTLASDLCLVSSRVIENTMKEELQLLERVRKCFHHANRRKSNTLSLTALPKFGKRLDESST